MPSLTARGLMHFLEKQGFSEVRQAGSHLTIRRESDGRTVTLPTHTDKDIGRGLERHILREAGISVEEYYRLR